MRVRMKLPVWVVLALVALPVGAHADDNIDFLKRFLDASPNTAPETTNLAEQWISEVADSKGTSSPAKKTVSLEASLREPVRVARRGDVPKPRPKADLTSQAQPSSTGSIPIPTPAVATEQVSAADLAEVKRIEAGVNRQMQRLQTQLEREEKALESQLGRLNKQRSAALEKGDEATLKKIEQQEATAVASYERKIQRFLSAAVPSATPTTHPSKTQTRNVARQQPVQRPVANRRQASGKQVPSWAMKQNQARAASQQQALLRQQQAQKQSTMKRLAPPQQSQPTPAQPEKRKRFKLWPFR